MGVAPGEAYGPPGYSPGREMGLRGIQVRACQDVDLVGNPFVLGDLQQPVSDGPVREHPQFCGGMPVKKSDHRSPAQLQLFAAYLIGILCRDGVQTPPKVCAHRVPGQYFPNHKLKYDQFLVSVGPDGLP